jgi:beta-galactosidase
VYQYIKVKPVDVLAGKLTIENKYDFINLDQFEWAWSLAENGRIIQSGVLAPVSVLPNRSAAITIPFEQPVITPGAEYWLTVAFKLKKDLLWARQGHVVAFEQLAIPFTRIEKPAIDLNEIANLTCHQDNNQVRIQGKMFEVIFKKNTGILSSLVYDNRLYIDKGPVFNLYRATMDNDRTQERGPYLEWEKAGYDSLQYQLKSFTVDTISRQWMQLTTVTDAVTRSGFITTTQIRYTVFGNGEIEVQVAFTPSPTGLAIPRLGVQMILPQNLEYVEWYGRGPHENYSDRATSAPFGQYRSTVTQMVEPYERPQGMGNREAIRWVSICDEDKYGIKIEAHGPLSFTALHYTDQDLHKAAHLYQLQPRKETMLSLDYTQQGIGNASCGPDQLAVYKIPFQPAKLSFSIKPYQINN